MAEGRLEQWLSCMRRGDFAEAWEISDASVAERRSVSCAHLPRPVQHVWNGDSLCGKRVLIRCYRGLGDTIQFVRYATLVKAIASEVILWAQPRLLPLLQSVSGIDRLLPVHDGTPDVDYDIDVEIMELPHVFRSTLETIPREVPYVSARAARVSVNGDLRVGIAWRAGERDPSRSVPFGMVTAIADIPRVTVFVLQHVDEPHERDPRVVIRPERDTPEGTASLMRALDMVISVDSMPAHLAGALGLPVWTLLPANPDWRWMATREDSPWYPTMRLFRQEHPENWSDVITRVVSEVRRLRRRSMRAVDRAASNSIPNPFH